MLASRNAGTLAAFNVQYYLNVYLALGIASTVLVTVRALFIACHRVAASRALHANLLSRMLRAPIALFDATPIGRLLNRFSRDVDVVDSELAPSIAQVLGTMFNVFGSLAAIAVATKGVFLIPAIPLLWAFRWACGSGRCEWVWATPPPHVCSVCAARWTATSAAAARSCSGWTT